MSPQLSAKEAARYRAYRERADKLTRICVIEPGFGDVLADAPLESITTRLTIDLETRKYTSTDQIPNQQFKEKKT